MTKEIGLNKKKIISCINKSPMLLKKINFSNNIV